MNRLRPLRTAIARGLSIIFGKGSEPLQLQAEHPVVVSHPEKYLWPEARITKAEYIQYVIEMSPYLLVHLKDRSLTMIRYPDGVHGHSFYQKNKPVGTPEWVKTERIWSQDKQDYMDSVLVDSIATLIWLANLACLEFHVGFSTVLDPDRPTSVAFDLDPTVPGFEPVREVAMELHNLLSNLSIPHVAKTSGATGLQIYIPLSGNHSYHDTRIFTRAVAEYLLSKLPNIVTLERLTKNRGQKVYVDYLQHGQSRTLIAPYSTRATRFATVSTPITFSELQRGCVPEDFTVHNVVARVKHIGDLMAFEERISLHEVIRFLSNKQTSVSLS